MKINSVRVREANLPPLVNEFLEEFADCSCASLIDFFSSYNQMELAEESKNMTAFITPLSLLQITIVPQGATNLGGQFVRTIILIL